jgi:phage-related protein
VRELWHIEEHRGSIRKLAGNLIDPRDLSDATALLDVLRIRGNQMAAPLSRSLGGGLFELRGKQVRIFYVFRSGRRIVVLDCTVKKRSDIPRAVLDRLRKLAREVS